MKTPHSPFFRATVSLAGAIFIGGAWPALAADPAPADPAPAETAPAADPAAPTPAVAAPAATPAAAAPAASQPAAVDARVTQKVRAVFVEKDQIDKAADFRRKALDLVGIPPSPEAVSGFVADQSPDALARALRRMLGKRPWTAEQATGPADTPTQGDFSTAWASREPDGGAEWLALHFDKPVDVDKVAIYETYNPGAITKVTARDPQQQEITLAEDVKGLRSSSNGMPLQIVPTTGVTSGDVLLYLNTALVPGWNEIDAVRIDGRDGTSQWAADASASSSFGDLCPALRHQEPGQAGKLAKSLDCVACHAAGVTKLVSPKVEPQLALDLNRLTGRINDVAANLQRIQPRYTQEYTDFVSQITGSSDQRRAVLGVRLEDLPASAKSDSGASEGALVNGLLSGSPAEKAGLQKGDVILRVNGISTPTATRLREVIGVMEPGTIVVVAYQRNGSEAVITATLAAPPDIKTLSAHVPAAKESSPSWGPEQACGAPDTPKIGDIPTAWAPASADEGIEWLRLYYDRPVPVESVVVYQSLGPGAITKVTATTPSGDSMLLSEVTDPSTYRPHAASDSAVPARFRAPKPGVVSRVITVELDTAKVPGWNEIDAVELIGEDGTRQWASRATASSYFGQPAGAAFRKAETLGELEQRIAQISERIAALEQRMQKVNRPPVLVRPVNPNDLRFVPRRSGPGRAGTGHSWSPEQACGAPDTPKVGDFGTAWAPGTPDAGEEWLEVRFDRPVEASRLRVYESCGPGALRRLTALLPSGQGEDILKQKDAHEANSLRDDGLREVPVCDINDTTNAQDGADVPVKEIDIPANFKATGFRLYLDTKSVPGWNEIDAVELVGRDGSKQWATAARASSSYYDRYKGYFDSEIPALKEQ